jgi:peroxiredoxin
MNLFNKKEKKLAPGDGSQHPQSSAEPSQILSAGSAAPDFSLSDASGESISLADYRGRSVIIAFYPADWSPVCGDQLALYNEVLPLFGEYDAQLIGVSVDGKWSHRAYAEDRKLEFPLLSDFEPKGEVSRKYGVYNFEYGQSERALFVIDGQGVIRWSYLSPSNVNPGADGILSALESIKT